MNRLFSAPPLLLMWALAIPSAHAHEGHGLSGPHLHGVDVVGLAIVALAVVAAALWFKGRK
jgi:hypothetical protein